MSSGSQLLVASYYELQRVKFIATRQRTAGAKPAEQAPGDGGAWYDIKPTSDHVGGQAPRTSVDVRDAWRCQGEIEIDYGHAPQQEEPRSWSGLTEAAEMNW